MKKIFDMLPFASRKSQSDIEANDGSASAETFADLNLDAPLLAALAHEGYKEPTPIQVKAIPHVLTGKDLLGCAQTGTGKTAAFALPILQRISRKELATRHNGICALILAPTRELAVQIGEGFAAYGAQLPIKYTVIFGGVGENPQIAALKRSPQIVVATPGRLLDLMNRGFVDLSTLSIFVLDEADRMLDMGFIPDIKKILKVLPRARQTLLFSATMPPKIRELTTQMLKDPVYVEVVPPATTAETIDQKVFFVAKAKKVQLLQNLLATDETMQRVLVFTRTKHGANRVAKAMDQVGHTSAAIHGNKSQLARQRALNSFKSGELRVLVASDIASRGIDIDEVTHVVNLDIPNIAETYVHRIGRTGRAKAVGIAISFCDVEERTWLRDIEKLIGLSIPVIKDHPVAQNDQAEKPKETSSFDYERRENPTPNHRGGQRRSGPNNRGPGDRRPSNRGPFDRRPSNDGPRDRRPSDKGPGDRRPNDKGPYNRRPSNKGPGDRRLSHREFGDRRPNSQD